MVSFKGLDPERMEPFGVRLHAAATRLKGLHSGLATTLARVDWQGAGAERFRTDWAGSYRTQFAAAAQELEHLAKQVHAEVAAQLAASGAGAYLSSTSLAPGGIALAALTAGQLRSFYNRRAALEAGASVSAVFLKRFPGMPWAVKDGHVQAQSMSASSAQEQQAWWNGLTADQQKALVFAYPELILGIAGLPASALAAARAQFFDQQQGRIAARVDEQTSSIKANVGVFVLSGEGKATLTTYGDGHATVTLELDGGIGRQVGADAANAGVAVEGGVATTYTFANAQEAQAFVDGLKHEIRPGGDPMQYLQGYSPNVIDTTVHLQAEAHAEASIGGQTVSLSGAAGAEYDITSGHRTVYVEGDAEANAGGVNAGIHGKVALEMDRSGHVVTATVSGSAHVASGVEAKALVESLSGQQLAGASVAVDRGAEVSFSVQVDPSDPAIQAQLRQLVEHPDSTAAMSSLFASSEATVQVSSTSSTSSSASAGPLEVSQSASSSVAAVSYAKPAHGGWVDVTPRTPAGRSR